MRPCASGSTRGLPDARPAGRRGRALAAPVLHRLGQPHGRWSQVRAGPPPTLVVALAVARDSRVCVCDRAGRGWSDVADGPQDAAQIAAGLHTLLERATVPGPYVLAGHSFGGLYVQTFAANYPDEVAGLVLLDSTAPKPVCAPTRTDPTTSSDASPPCSPRWLT